MSGVRCQVSGSCSHAGRWVFAFLIVLLSGCMSGSVSRFAENLGRAVGAHDDPVLVRSALPAYLLLIDGLIEGDPHAPALLEAGAWLYTAYAGLLGDEETRAAKLTERAMTYACRARRCRARRAPDLRACRFDVLEKHLAAATKRDVASLYTLGSAWAGWIRAHPEAVSAAADIPRVEAIMERVVALDPSHGDGAAYMILGSLTVLLPADLGGDREKAHRCFEQAVKLSGGKNLMVSVLYARQYAVATGNRTLYRRLLQQVVDAPAVTREHRLTNTIAREQAQRLLADEARLFEKEPGK